MKRIAALFCAIVGMGQLFAQEFVDNNQKYVEEYVNSANEIILKNESLSVDQAAEGLKKRKGPAAVGLLKAARKKLDAPAVYDKVKQATVIMGSAYLCPYCSHTHVAPASGYIIDPSGIVVTNYHVAAVFAFPQKGNTPMAFLARMEDGRTFPVKAVLAASERDDLAVIQLDTKGEKLPALALAEKGIIGEQAFVVGHPKGLYYYFSQGYVTHKYRDRIADDKPDELRDAMVISADYAVGSSGGPVVNAYGNVIGTVSNTRTLLVGPENPSVQMVLKNTIPVESLWKLIKH